MLARTIKSLVPDALKWKLRKWVWMRLNPSWQLRSGIIIRVLNYNDWMIYNDIFVDGEYDPPIEELLASAPGGARVLDLGGNVGFFTLRVADVFLRQGRSDFEVIMVEGSPSTFAELNQRLAANEKLLQKRVRSVNGLAGERTGAAVIAEAPSHGENSIVTPARGGQRVPFVDLEELVGSWDRIDLLKCDIEGAEELFLGNYPGLLRKSERAVFEFHHDLCDIPLCRRRLAEAGLTQVQMLRESGRCSVESFSRA
ncbi:MAG TPA: FkbM family methyltransferase [Chthoniobacterales bacterium]|nr:FkbM family methyltransferase [Chthoniobacterales bacterium]